MYSKSCNESKSIYNTLLSDYGSLAQKIQAGLALVVGKAVSWYRAGAMEFRASNAELFKRLKKDHILEIIELHLLRLHLTTLLKR